MDFFFCFRNLILNVGLLVQILLVLAITFQVSVFYVQQMGIKIQQGLKKKGENEKVEARFSSCPYSCVCERNNTADVNSVGCGQQATYIVEIQFPLDNSKIHKKIIMLLTISFVTLVA